MGPNPAIKTGAKSRSIIREKLEVLEMKEYSLATDLEIIIDDFPMGESNRRSMKYQYLVKCLSCEFGYRTKQFCISKKWSYHRSCHSDKKSYLTSRHWSNNFKEIHNKKKIDNATMNMANSHLRNVFTHHILKHGSKSFLYFKYEKIILCQNGSSYF